MRQKFNLDTCMRPCIGFPGNPLKFIRKRADGGFEEPRVNVVVFRQNTEGHLCRGRMDESTRSGSRRAATHSKFKAFADVPGSIWPISVRIITRAAARRICKAAFEYAKKNGIQKQ